MSENNPDLPAATAQQRYRKSEKCKVARARYYESKGKSKAHEYYLKNKDKIIARSKERYNNLKNNLGKNDTENA